MAQGGRSGGAGRPTGSRQAVVVGPTDEGIARAAELLRRGELVGLPTETVYGLAALALDSAAVGRVFAVKERPLFDPLIVHVAPGEPERALAPVVALDQLRPPALRTARRLWGELWPGPLTLVLPRTRAVHDLVTSGLETVAVRMPDHPIATRIIEAVGAPLAAPSANRFGRISPTSASDVIAELGDRIPLVVDGGRCSVGVESTVVAVEPDGSVRVLRPGGVSIEELARFAPTSLSPGSRASPGQTASHYAPRTPLTLLGGPVDVGSIAPLLGVDRRIAVLSARGPEDRVRDVVRTAGGVLVDLEVLSATGDATEAAHGLFASLRRLDASGASRIVAEPWAGDVGLGYAIDDRLARAARG